MLDASQVMEALEAKREQFLAFQRTGEEAVVMLGLALESLAAIPPAELAASLAGIPRTGARPTMELGQFDHIVIPFETEWNNLKESQDRTKLITGISPAFAVDSSQILPTTEMSVLVGLIQVGWFENCDPSNREETKEVFVEVVTAADVYTPEGRSTGSLEETINWRRIALEINRLIEYMEANATANPKPVCFLAGPLAISFAQHLFPEHQALYVNALRRLLATSAETEVPLVGYVETAYANDLTVLAAHAASLSPDFRISDVGLLRSRMNWRDRTQVFICDRDGGLQDKYYNDVCFAYLKTTSHNPPARVEFPRWILDRGEHGRLIDLVRTECLITNYPFAMKMAKANAVLTTADRERFYTLFQRFAEQVNLPLRFNRKVVSKRQRRM